VSSRPCNQYGLLERGTTRRFLNDNVRFANCRSTDSMRFFMFLDGPEEQNGLIVAGQKEYFEMTLSSALRMVGIDTKVGEQEGLAGGFGAPALRLDGHKDCIDAGQGCGVIGFQDPPLIVPVVLIQHS